MSERDYAKMEGSRIACCDAYFDARPDRDYHINRSLFDAGHDAGWKAMQTERDELIAALKEARRWIGDGDMSDGLDKQIWTLAYSKLVSMIDEAISKCEA